MKNALWSSVALKQFMGGRGKSVNPVLYPDEEFDLFSVPAYDSGLPDHVTGNQIGSTKQAVEPDDVLLSKIVPHIRRAWIVPRKGSRRMIGSSEWMIFSGNDLHPPFLRHYFLTDSFNQQLMLTVSGVGGSLLRARPSHVGEITLPLPPLGEQKRLAAILDQADAIRRKRQQALRLTDDFLRSVFLDFFGDPVTNPKGWPKISIGELLKVKSGNAMIGKNMAIGGTYPVYGGNGISGYHDEFMFSDRRVVLGRVGVYCGAVHYTQPNSWITDNALYVSEIRKPFDELYLLAALGFANLNQYAGQAAQPLISGGRIYPVEILDPPLSVQSVFSRTTVHAEKTKARQEEAQTAAETLFQSLQHRAFTGQL